MREITEQEVGLVSGGNAQDTVTGSFGEASFNWGACMETTVVSGGPGGSIGAAWARCVISYINLY